MKRRLALLLALCFFVLLSACRIQKGDPVTKGAGDDSPLAQYIGENGNFDKFVPEDVILSTSDAHSVAL